MTFNQIFNFAKGGSYYANLFSVYLFVVILYRFKICFSYDILVHAYHNCPIKIHVYAITSAHAPISACLYKRPGLNSTRYIVIMYFCLTSAMNLPFI